MTTEQAKNPSWFKTLLLVAAIILGIGYLFRFFTPQQVAIQPLLEKNYSGDTTKFSGITFTGNIPTIPNTLPIAKAQDLLADSDQIQKKLIEYFSLTKFPEAEDNWVGSKYSLTKMSSQNQYIVTAEAPIPNVIVSDIQKAKERATALLTELLPNNNWEIIENKIVFLSGDEEYTEAPQLNKGLLIKIPFGYQIASHPVFLSQYQEPLAEVFINGNYEVQRVTLSPYSTKIQPQQSIKTLSIGEALDNINHGHGAIIGVFYQEYGNPSLKTVTSGKMSSATIEYRIDPSTQSILPYYHFSGEMTNSNSQTFNADVITPAIQTKFDQS